MMLKLTYSRLIFNKIYKVHVCNSPWTWCCWKLFPGAKWKFPATLFTSKWPVTKHPSFFCSFSLSFQPSRTHCIKMQQHHKNIDYVNLISVFFFVFLCTSFIFNEPSTKISVWKRKGKISYYPNLSIPQDSTNVFKGVISWFSGITLPT